MIGLIARVMGRPIQKGAAPIAKYRPLLPDSWYNTGNPSPVVSMNTPIIAYTSQSVNASAKIQRPLYTIEQGRDVCKSSFKLEHGLTPRRVFNGLLFNNATLKYVSDGYKPSTATVGLLWRGAERKYEGVYYIWQEDQRGKQRRKIPQKAFRALPTPLQQVARDNGVKVDADYVCFSRCTAAWAGQNVKGMHVHHVNMDTTDDRLGNLQVLTPSEHQAMHHDTGSLVWDADWYEYTSTDGGMLRTAMAVTIDEDDIAQPIEGEDDVDPCLYEARRNSPPIEEVLATLRAQLAQMGKPPT